KGQEVSSAGDGFFVGFDSPDDALACAVAIQRRLDEHRRSAGFAPKVRIGLHASGATQVGTDFTGKGVHEAARIAALADGNEIVPFAPSMATGISPVTASFPTASGRRSMSVPVTGPPSECAATMKSHGTGPMFTNGYPSGDDRGSVSRQKDQRSAL